VSIKTGDLVTLKSGIDFRGIYFGLVVGYCDEEWSQFGDLWVRWINKGSISINVENERDLEVLSESR